MDNDFARTKEAVRQELANYLGLEPTDIEDDSSLTEDLHMKASDLTDFMEVLTRMKMDTSGIDWAEDETFSDLVESITEKE
jgi:isopentenyldiphosphate isomerase